MEYNNSNEIKLEVQDVIAEEETQDEGGHLEVFSSRELQWKPKSRTCVITRDKFKYGTDNNNLIKHPQPEICIEGDSPPDVDDIVKLENYEEGTLIYGTRSKSKSRIEPQKLTPNDKSNEVDRNKSKPRSNSKHNEHANKVLRKKSKSVNRNEVKKPINVKPCACYVCGKTFGCRSSLEIHIRIHTGEKPYLCDVCGQTFSQQGDMIIHGHIHTGFRPKKCPECGKGFRKSGDMYKHIRRMHTLEKPFQCEICDKEYCTRDRLVSHLTSHTGEKPHKCHICYKSFTYKSVLVRHRNTVHVPGGTIFCAICKKEYCEDCKRKGHELVYRFECEICGKMFADPNTLKTHRRGHDEDTSKSNSFEMSGDVKVHFE